ncbi:MAG: thioesterase [Planctomycetota bacterium]|nr:MAG: thioesterase [Planctomycetota bacterium]
MLLFEKLDLKLEDAVISRFVVRYGETDQMAFAYYGRYFEWFEVARVDWLKDKGVTYKEMEENNVFLPVVEAKSKYISPNRYDDEIIIFTWAKSVTKRKIEFLHIVKNSRTKLITTEAEICLIPVDKLGKPTRFNEKYFNLFQS